MLRRLTYGALIRAPLASRKDSRHTKGGSDEFVLTLALFCPVNQFRSLRRTQLGSSRTRLHIRNRVYIETLTAHSYSAP